MLTGQIRTLKFNDIFTIRKTSQTKVNKKPLKLTARLYSN